MPRYSIKLTSLVSASAGQLSCDLGGEAAILNLKTGTCYGLNPVGARIWSLLTAPTRVAALRDAIVQEYDVEPACCEADLFDLLQKLASEDLIQVDEQ